jgi:hypothetical protein
VFGRRAQEILAALQETWPELEMTLNQRDGNPKPPRKGAFELTLLLDGQGNFLTILSSQVFTIWHLIQMNYFQVWLRQVEELFFRASVVVWLAAWASS